jgi:SAM-dependent methyltransferase
MPPGDSVEDRHIEPVSRATPGPRTHAYDHEFFEYINEGSSRSARRIVPLLLTMSDPRSVLDVGCGAGAWLREWSRHDLDDWTGVDGDYVDAANLLIPEPRFHRHDLSKPFALGRKFDLVYSFEVAEHIAPVFADQFVDSLVEHGDHIAFSAATPGQGGEFHVNEQPYDYWRAKFLARGYQCFDALRPLIVADREIEPWYRYNTLIFANAEGEKRLSAEARTTRVDEHSAIPDLAPMSWKLRRAVLSRLPRPVIEGLAAAVHRLALAGRR